MVKRQGLVLAVAALALAAGAIATAQAAQPTPAHGHSLPLLSSAPRHGTAPGPGCGFHRAIPFDRYKGLPDYTATRAAEPYIALLHTTQGLIVIKMLTSNAPCTAFSFRFLAQREFFNQTHCHRLTTEGIYVLQCGDPTGTGSGGPGYEFNDENLAGAVYPAGTVAMANAGPNTNGSQFFFTWKNTTLAPDYTPFGKVIEGMSVLRKIAAAGDDQQNGPGDGYPHLYAGINSVGIDLLK
jgi:peptidyl-prolyl cis-trans isomerase B (cyclophilin B)